jgi:plastocyanin
MKKSLLFVVPLVILGVGVIVATAMFTNHYLQKDSQHAAADSCHGKTGTTHTITIANDKMDPDHIDAQLCDKLTVTNTDDKVRDMAFGVHDHHQAYDGTTEKSLAKNQSLTVTLEEAGNYKLHDHLDDDVAGTFTVSK